MNWDNPTPMFWENEDFKYQSDLTVQDSGIVEARIYSLTSLEPLRLPDFLFGRTIEGQCISAHNLKDVGDQNFSSIHNFDRANCALIENSEEFHAYVKRIHMQSCFIGDSYIQESNPLVDHVSVTSQDLVFLSFCYWEKEGVKRQTIFENGHIVIELVRGENRSIGHKGTLIERVFYLKFDFKRAVRLNHAMHDWVKPILGLFEIILGGEIIEDHITFLSKSLKAEFSPVWLAKNVRRKTENEPTVNTSIVTFNHIASSMQRIISNWVERPNPLRWINGFYSAALYGKGHLEDMFTTSTRLAEAAYASIKLLELFKVSRPSLRECGVFDFKDADIVGFDKKMRELAKPGNYPFLEKMKFLTARYEWMFLSDNYSGIDWKGCLTVCRDLRNTYSHGSVFDKKSRTDSDSLFALGKMGIIIYEAAAIEQFELSDELTKICLLSVAERNCFKPQIEDLWGIDRVMDEALGAKGH